MYARWSSLVTVPETWTAAISTLCRFHVHTPMETKYTALASRSSPVQLLKWQDRWCHYLRSVANVCISFEITYVSTPFGISVWVTQGDVLSATLFNLVLHKALKNLKQSSTILNRLTQICEYTDDILVIARSLPALEALCVELSREAGRVGLVVSPDKTKYMRFPASPSRR